MQSRQHVLYTVASVVEALQESWTFQIASSGGEHANAIETAGNDIIVAGFTYDSLDQFSNAGQYDFFVMKLDSSGSKMWTFQDGTSGGDNARGVRVESASGDIFVVGGTYEALYGAWVGSWDIWAIKLDSSGNHVWGFQTGTVTDEDLYAVAIDSSGNLLAGGFTWGLLDSPSSANTGSRNIMVIQLDSLGSLQWTFQRGSGSQDILQDLRLDASDNIFVTGWTDYQFDGYTTEGSHDAFVMKIDNVGAFKWVFQAGSAGEQSGNRGCELDQSFEPAWVVECPLLMESHS